MHHLLSHVREAAILLLSVQCLLYPHRGQLFRLLALPCPRGSYSFVVNALLALPCPGGSYSVIVNAVLPLPSPGAAIPFTCSCSPMTGRQLFCRCRARSSLSGGSCSINLLSHVQEAAIPLLSVHHVLSPCPGGRYSVVVSAMLALPSRGAA